MSRRTKTLATLAIACLGVPRRRSPRRRAPHRRPPGSSAWLPSRPTSPPGLTSVSGNLFPEFALAAANVGAAPTSGPITISVQLPSGISPAAAVAPTPPKPAAAARCSVAGQTVTCTDTDSIGPGGSVKMSVPVDVANLTDPTALSATGGDLRRRRLLGYHPRRTTISATPAPFGLLPGAEGLNASAVAEDGAPATQAGSHPQQVERQPRPADDPRRVQSGDRRPRLRPP